MRARALCLAVPLVAGTLAGSRAEIAPSDHLNLAYESYSAGVRVASMTADLRLDPTDYRLAFAFHTTGVIGVLFDSRSESLAEGRFTPAIRPTFYLSGGTYRGHVRATRIDYPAGTPALTLLTPPDSEPREPIPPAQQAASLDPLSAIAHMLRQVARTGRCDDRRTTYDGRRLLALQSTTGGDDDLPASARSPWSGMALRCDLTSQQTAGFLRDADPETAHKIRHATAWLQQVIPGGPLVPVRLDIETAWIAMAHVYLVSVQNVTD